MDKYDFPDFLAGWQFFSRPPTFDSDREFCQEHPPAWHEGIEAAADAQSLGEYSLSKEAALLFFRELLERTNASHT